MQRRTEAEFERMVRDCARPLASYANNLTNDRMLAEEAVQETFIRAWRYWPTFRGESSHMTWLVTICRRVMIDLARKERRHDPLPENVVDARDDFAATAINDLVSELPVAQREVVVLCAMLGFDYESAAAIIGVPVGTVRSRLSRARETLGQRLDSTLAV